MLIIINDEKDDFSWTNCQALLQDPNFHEKMKFFDLNNINQGMIDRVTPITKEENFNFEYQKKNGGCTAFLTEWVVKLVAYHPEFEIFKPLEKQAEDMKKDFKDKEFGVKVIFADVEKQQ